MMDDNPLRTFVVRLSPLIIDGIIVAPARDESVQAHLHQVTADGGLQLLHYAGGVPWTVRLYPPGIWVGAEGSVPTAEDCVVMQGIAEQERQRREFLETKTGKRRH